MADETEVAPPTAEKNNEDPSIVSIGDIAEAAGLGSTIFDNASEDEPQEAATAEPEDQSEENIEPVAQEQEQPKEEQVEPAESEGVKKRIGKLVESRNNALDRIEELEEKIKSLEENRKQERKPVVNLGLERFDGVKNL